LQFCASLEDRAAFYGKVFYYFLPKIEGETYGLKTKGDA